MIALCVALMMYSTHGSSSSSGLFSEVSSQQGLLSVVDAFFVLFEVLVVVLSRVVHWFGVGVVGFDVDGVVDDGGMRSCVTFISLCLYDNPHRPSLLCLELVLHFFRHRPCS